MKYAYIVKASIIVLLLVSNLSAFKDGDLQLWTTFNIEGKIGDYWKLKIEEEFEYGKNIHELYCHFTDGGVTHNRIKWFYWGLNYRHIYSKSSSGWTAEYRPHLNLGFKWKWKILKFGDNNRFELRNWNGKKSKWRYRNKFSLTFSGDWTSLNLEPFIAYEMFIDLSDPKFSIGWLSTGLKLKLCKYLYSNIYYLWQTANKSGNWLDYNVIGLKIMLKF